MKTAESAVPKRKIAIGFGFVFLDSFNILFSNLTFAL
jgi:hypothetical protein